MAKVGPIFLNSFVHQLYQARVSFKNRLVPLHVCYKVRPHSVEKAQNIHLIQSRLVLLCTALPTLHDDHEVQFHSAGAQRKVIFNQTFDCHLTMETHVSILVRSANFELRRISSIRHLLSTDATKTLVSAFVLSCLDYCNSLLFGCPQYLLNKLQKVQNNAARLVLRVSKTDHISPHLASLHWLPIDSRIQYKLSSLCYNCLNSTAPDYLTELLRIYKPTRQLRSSSDTSILCIPAVRTHSLGQRSFSYAAPTVWNTLPYEIRSSNTISSFKSSLKTYLFQQSY